MHIMLIHLTCANIFAHIGFLTSLSLSDKIEKILLNVTRKDLATTLLTEGIARIASCTCERISVYSQPLTYTREIIAKRRTLA